PFTIMTAPRTILVEAANGYIGGAVCRAFSRAGWRVFGLVRRPEAAAALAVTEVIPIISTLPSLAFLEDLYRQAKTIDVIAVCAAPPDFAAYYPPTLEMLQDIAQVSNKHGVKPLVLWTSGSKDYGHTQKDGDADLAPHTEESPIDPIYFLAPRANFSLKVLDHRHLFDAAVLRPTNVFGYSSSILGCAFDFAERAAANGDKTLKVAVSPSSILHLLHVDDCGDAYLALAEHGDRGTVAGECFNLSGRRYETSKSVLQALASEYQLEGGVEFVDSAEGTPGASVTLTALFGYSQWCSSDKVRALTGWTDRRIPFPENMHAYRLAYDGAVKFGDENVARSKSRQAALDSLGGMTAMLPPVGEKAELC
ncbi:NAD(P)-binding protein, partial [Thozetella sp. PMI_491]